MNNNYNHQNNNENFNQSSFENNQSSINNIAQVSNVHQNLDNVATTNDLNQPQSSNDNPSPKIPKKNNLGLLIKIGALVAVGCIAVVGISMLIGKDKTPTNNMQNSYDENIESDNKNDTNQNSSKYESSLMSPDRDLTKINGSIKDIGYDIVITNDNKIYRTYKLEYITTLNTKFEKIVDNATDERTLETLIKNTDGTYSLIDITDKKIEATYKIENIIYASQSGYIYTIEDGYLYCYNVEDDNLGNKTRLYLDIAESWGGTQNIYKGKVEVVKMVTSVGRAYIRLEDGSIRTFDASLRTLRSVGTYLESIGNVKYIEGKEPDNIYGYFDLYGLAYYSVKNDDKHLYYTPEIILSGYAEYKTCIESKTVNECYDEKKITFDMPSGHVVSDIQKVYQVEPGVEEELLITMKNGDIYYYKGQKYYTSDELNKLNKEGHIRKILTDYDKIHVLCDDNYLYEVSEYQLTKDNEVK